jgi:hypothetical protein
LELYGPVREWVMTLNRNSLEKYFVHINYVMIALLVSLGHVQAQNYERYQPKSLPNAEHAAE